MTTRMLRRAEVQAMTGLSVSGIYKALRENRFPRPVKVTRTAVRWPRAEIEDWLASRPRANHGGEAA